MNTSETKQQLIRVDSRTCWDVNACVYVFGTFRFVKVTYPVWIPASKVQALKQTTMVLVRSRATWQVLFIY